MDYSSKHMVPMDNLYFLRISYIIETEKKLNFETKKREYYE